MDAEQLWETTLNPETRMLKRVEIEDARMASACDGDVDGYGSTAAKRHLFMNMLQDAELDV